MINGRKVNLKEAGITLTALVVTIIVILILAGVTISMVAGDNGIFNRARLAKESYENAALKEAADLNSLDGWISGQMDRIDDNGEDGEDGQGGITLSQEDYQQLLEAIQTQNNEIKTLKTTSATQANTIASQNSSISTLNTKVSSIESQMTSGSGGDKILLAQKAINKSTYDENFYTSDDLTDVGKQYIDVQSDGSILVKKVGFYMIACPKGAMDDSSAYISYYEAESSTRSRVGALSTYSGQSRNAEFFLENDIARVEAGNYSSGTFDVKLYYISL